MGTLRTSIPSSGQRTNGVAFSPDGQIFAAGGNDSLVHIYDAKSGSGFGKELAAFSVGSQQVTHLAFSPDSSSIAAAAQGLDSSVGSVSLLGGEGLFGAQAVSGHAGRVTWVDFAPDGATYASSSLDLTIRQWDARSGAQLRSFTGHEVLPTSVATGVWTVRYSPDGRQLASGGSDRTIRIWDIASGNEIRKITDHSGVVFSVAYSPDGNLLASASEDGTIKLSNPNTGDKHGTLGNHGGWVVSIAFSPDGSLLASASYDGTSRLWDVASGALVDTLSRGDAVHDVAFAPSGASLANGGEDGSVKIYYI